MQSKIKFFLLFIGITFFALILGGPLTYFLLYTLAALLLLTVIHSTLGALSIRAEVKVQEGEIYAGDTIEIDYRIWTTLPISFPKVELENNMAYRLTGKKTGIEIFSLERTEPYLNKMKITCWRRGDHKIGDFKIRIGDIFNLFSFGKTISVPIHIRVYPRIIPIYSLPLKSIIPMGDIWVKSYLLQDYTEVSDLKPYQEGDNIKKIHWKASAKQEGLLVKNFEPKGDTKVTICINSSAKSYANDKDHLIEDKAVEVTLSVVNYCLKFGIATSIYYEEQGQRIHIEGNYLSDLRIFMDRLVLFQPKENSDFGDQTMKYSSVFSQGETVVFITPTIDKKLAMQGVNWKNRGINLVYILLEENRPHTKDEMNHLIQKLREEGIAVHQLKNMDLSDLSLGLEGEK